MKTFNSLTTKVLEQRTIAALILFLFLGAFSLSAQNSSKVVNGTVVDNVDNSPIPGVTVQLKGSDSGTVTDIDGKFEISVPSDESVLIFSFVGMTTQEVRVGAVSNLDISLSEDAVGLSEVIVVGYGVQKKENLSGAVDAISTEQLKSRPISNVAQGLQGISPNFNVDFTSGEPGQAARFNIRGITSINGGQPLILVDGVPSDAAELNRIAPGDIESISVLKDASSAAIYGARAAFGVVLITTKAGTQDGVRISYSNNFSTGTPTVIPDKITDPYIYLRLRETSTDNTPWDNQNYSDETYAWARDRSNDPSLPGVRVNPNDATSWEYMGDRDWTRYFLDDYTTQQNHYITVDGKSSSTQYLISGSYNRQNGALKLADDYFDLYSLRAKVNYNVNDWLTIGNNTYLTSTERKRPSYFSLWNIYNFHPTEWDKNPDGSWANSPVGVEGARLTDGGESTTKYNSFQTTLSAEVRLFNNALKFNTDFTTRRGTEDFDRFFTSYQIGFGPDDIREQGNNEATRANTTSIYNVFNAYLTFNKQFGEQHNLTVIGGYNQEDNTWEYFRASRDNLISASLPSIALATGTADVNEIYRDWAVQGLFYRVNYIFNNKYILEFNGRYDGSSRFPSDKRWGFFPSASAAWRVDQEDFLINNNLVSSLKLRGSYGSLGNQFVSEYGYIPTMTALNGSYIIDGALPQRITPPQLVSSNYTWEDVTSTNFGIDLGLFDDRFLVNFDYYIRDTKGMLTLGKDLPDVLGASEPEENAADLRTTGWELAVTYRNSTKLLGKPFHFDTKFVLSDTRSEITRFDNPNGNLTQFYEGMELGEIWGLTSDGLFQNDAEIEALDQTSLIPWGALSIVPGWPRYVDRDGNGSIEKGLTIDDPKDLSVIGNVLPRFRFGVNLGFEWAGFDVSAFFQGIGKRDYYPIDYLYWGFYQQPYAGGYQHLTDFYRGSSDSETNMAKHSNSYIDAGLANANTEAEYPVLQAWLADRNLGERVDQSKGLAIPQTSYLLDASYIRFKNLTIGYTLPSTLTDKIGIGSLRIFISGENIAEWSELKDYYDPEAITDIVDGRLNPAVSNSRQVGSGYVYPFQRRYAAGINLNF